MYDEAEGYILMEPPYYADLAHLMQLYNDLKSKEHKTMLNELIIKEFQLALGTISDTLANVKRTDMKRVK